MVEYRREVLRTSLGAADLMVANSNLPAVLAWGKQPYRLRFLFGELCLYSKPFRALVLKTHFLQIDQPPEQLISGMETSAGDVDMVVMGSVPIQRPYPKLSRVAGWLLYVPSHFPRHYVDLTMTFEAYMSTFSAKTRSTLRRKVRKFQEFSNGTLDFREYHNAERFEEFYPMALELSRRTYQHRLLDAGLPASDSFASSARALAAANQIRAYLLFHDGKPVAYLYCPAADGVLIYAHLGYDSNLAEWSCGTVLQYLAFERLFAEQTFNVFDFTEGEGEHKRLFGTGTRLCAQVLCFRPTVRHFVLVGGHAALASLSSGVVKLLDRLGLKRRLKRMLRRGGAPIEQRVKSRLQRPHRGS